MRSFQSATSRLVVTLGTLALFAASAEAFEPIPVPVASAQALLYHNASNWFWSVGQAVGLLLAFVLLVSGWGAVLYSKAARVAKQRRCVATTLFASSYFLLDRLVRLPVELLWDRAHDRLLGIASEPFVAWLGQQVGGWALPIVGTTVATLIGYWLVVKSSARWWLVASALSSVAVLAVLVAEPFTQIYKPLGNSALEQRIAELAGRAGVPRSSIVVERCDPPDSCPPGRVIGLGPTRRMLLNDALLTKNPERWTLQTIAHESKHFSQDDNVKAFVLLSGLAFAGLWLVNVLARLSIPRWSRQFGFSELGHPASLPLAVFVLTAAYLVALPPVNAFRQHVEFEADRFGLELNQDNEGQARMIASGTTGSNHRVPEASPFFIFFRSSHPTDGQRIRFANTYRPWRDGTPLVYRTEFAPRPDTGELYHEAP